MKKTIRDYNLNNKRVIIRCDFNVPMKDNNILDDTKIRESLETIKYACDHQAKVILMSHLGKIKTDSDKRGNSLYCVSQRLGELLNKKILFSPETRSEGLSQTVNSLKNGDILLIENTRYEDLNSNGESSCDENLSKYWASLGDIFINDAYGTCHRAHASNVGIARLLPNGIGFLVHKEITKIDEIMSENTHPFIVVMGGKKVSDKTLIIENLIHRCDKLLIGGAMSFTFLKALGYNVGNSIVEEENLNFCKEILSRYNNKIVLPTDFVTVKEITNNPEIELKRIDSFVSNDIGVDIGKLTIDLFTTHLKNAKRVVINGPMGIFEIDKLSLGTKAVYDCLVTNKIKTLIGGGETSASVNVLGFDEKFFHVSTGGGATLEYLEGKELPGISVIQDNG